MNDHLRAVPNRAVRSTKYPAASCDYGPSVMALRPVGREVEQAGSLEPDWVDRAVQLEREFGHELDWFKERKSADSEPEVVSPERPTRALSTEERAVREIFRLVALLALLWRCSPQLVFFALAGDAPDEAEWGKLVSRSWDGLTASARAHLNGLASAA